MIDMHMRQFWSWLMNGYQVAIPTVEKMINYDQESMILRFSPQLCFNI